ncbi:hypothetical protein ACFCX0_18670 [Streptomyces sp. NPDC056352]|uniref:hypothetical protein n=1 Tax=Streptomyces sp. NPDC056352 TaxID=3345791 RepID=UPI0035DF3D20
MGPASWLNLWDLVGIGDDGHVVVDPLLLGRWQQRLSHDAGDDRGHDLVDGSNPRRGA